MMESFVEWLELAQLSLSWFLQDRQGRRSRVVAVVAVAAMIRLGNELKPDSVLHFQLLIRYSIQSSKLRQNISSCIPVHLRDKKTTLPLWRLVDMSELYALAFDLGLASPPQPIQDHNFKPIQRQGHTPELAFYKNQYLKFHI
jgi:hypothetical protein